MDPSRAWRGAGSGPSPWPGRVDAVLTAFALHAASLEAAPADLRDAFASEA